MPKYTVIAGPLDHDDKRLVDGDTVDLAAKVGDRLADEGVVAKGVVKVEKTEDATGGDGSGDTQA